MTTTVSRRLPAVAVALAATLLIGATSATLLATTGVRHALTDATTGELPAADLRTFGLIAGRNLCAVLGLFTGVVTGGIGSVVFLLAIGATLGWSVGVSLDVLGAAETLSRAWLYTPFEVGGLVLAGAAGLLPLVTSLGQHRGETTRSDRFARALRWLGVAVVLILVGAAAETLAIALHS